MSHCWLSLLYIVVCIIEEGNGTPLRTLAWKTPWTEEPGRLQSMGSLRVRRDGATSLSLFSFLHWRRKWQPTPVFLPGESQGRGRLGGLPSMGSHRVEHDWPDLASALCIIPVSLLTKPEQSWSKNRQVECKCLFCAVTTHLKADLLHPTIWVHHLSSTNYDSCTKTHGSFVVMISEGY